MFNNRGNTNLTETSHFKGEIDFNHTKHTLMAFKGQEPHLDDHSKARFRFTSLGMVISDEKFVRKSLLARANLSSGLAFSDL